MNQEIVDDAELAKSYITSSSMSDDYKKAYIKLLNITTMATNGLSPEDKIQKMTEAIQLLAITQGMYMVNIEKTIDDAVQKANQKQCAACKAMKHANDVEEEEKNRKLIEDWKAANGIVDKKDEEAEDGWTRFLKQLLLKPYVYVVASILAISPYGIEIIRMIMQIWSS